MDSSCNLLNFINSRDIGVGMTNTQSQLKASPAYDSVTGILEASFLSDVSLP